MRTKQPFLRQFWSETRWILLGLAWLAGLVTGYIGFALFSQENGEGYSAGDILYRTLQLVTMNSGAVSGRVNWMLETARFLLPALTAYTALQGLMYLFREQAQVLRLWRLREHVVVCGMGRKGGRLVEELLATGQRVVVIEKEPAHEKADALRRLGAIVLSGDATNPDTLSAARIQRAHNLICVLGDDRDNLRVAYQAYRLSVSRSLSVSSGSSRSGKLTCLLHLTSTDLLELIKTSELSGEPEAPFELETFNSYARTARLLLQADPGWREAATPEEIARHLLVIGLGRLGESLVIQAAYQWHVLRRQGRLRMTLVDQAAEEKTRTLLLKYPRLDGVCDLIPLQIDLSAVGVMQNGLAGARHQAPIQRSYICLDNPVLSLQVCLSLLRIPGLIQGPVWVRLARDSGLAGLLDAPLPGLALAGQVKTFDLYDTACSSALLVGGTRELLARGLYEVYLSGTDDPAASPPWEGLSEELKEANRQQTSRIYRLLDAGGYQISPLQDWDAAERSFQEAEIESMARLEHDLWRQAKQAGGWRRGAQRDEKQHTHPDLVAWEELPEKEKEKNRLAVRRLPALLARLGFQIDRVMAEHKHTA